MNDEVKNLMDDILAVLNEDECPKVYDYLANLVFQDEELPEPTDIVAHLNEMRPYPRIIQDFIIELLELAVQNGDAAAMNDLGAMYYGGTGCEQSFEKAVYYYSMAAEHGDRQAQENLGYCYYYGRSVPVDYEKAFHYFALGAFDGHLISLYKIGDMYANGYYVAKNEREAFQIYIRCMDTMTDEAAPVAAGPVYLRLGKAFLYGKGTMVDAKSALICYQKAESYLYDMVKSGNNMYKKSLDAAVEGQARAREILAAALPTDKWTFD